MQESGTDRIGVADQRRRLPAELGGAGRRTRQDGLLGSPGRELGEVEAAPLARFGDVAHMRALAWCFVNEQDVFVGGQSISKPIYRVTVTIPDGARAYSVRSQSGVARRSSSA